MITGARVKSYAIRIVRTLGSWRAAALLVVAWATLIVVWIIPFQFYGLPATQMRNIVYRETFFQVLYAALTVSTLACMGLRIGYVWRKAKRVPSADAEPRLPEDFTRAASDLGTAVARVSGNGFRLSVSSESWAWGVRQRWSSLGTFALHGAMIVLVASGLVATYGPKPFTGEAVVSAGETFASRPEQWVSIQPDGAKPPQLSFTVEEVKADFYRDLLLFTKLEARVAEDGGRTRNIALAQPWVAGPATLVAIKDFGYSADVVSSTEASESPLRTFKLKVFPSEITDSFDVSVGAKTYRVYLRVYGDYVDREGSPGNRSFNLTNPRLLVSAKEVLTSKAEVERVPERLLAPGEPLVVPGGEVTIRAITRHAVFRVTVLPVAPYLFIAMLLAAVGAWLRLVSPRREVTLVKDGETGVAIIVMDDTYGRDTAMERRLKSRIESTR